MNTVDKTTAFALKEAGFPQPEPAFGQVWYRANGIPVAIMGLSSKGSFVFTAHYDYGMVQQHIVSREALAEMAFAPNAVDILAEMPDPSVLQKRLSLYLADTVSTRLYSYVQRDCPHEAMAARYFAMQAEQK